MMAKVRGRETVERRLSIIEGHLLSGAQSIERQCAAVQRLRPKNRQYLQEVMVLGVLVEAYKLNREARDDLKARLLVLSRNAVQSSQMSARLRRSGRWYRPGYWLPLLGCA